MTDSASQLIWRNADESGHKYHEESYGGPCATCSAYTEIGIGTEQINNKTFSNHSEFFKFGNHVCPACAWLYGDPKRAHRNVLAVGDELWWPMIGVDSATYERPSWLDLLRDLPDRFDGDEPQCGVLTTDPKPRNWPRMALGTSRHLSLYVHAPDYDTATVVHLDALKLRDEFFPPIRKAQLAAFSKKRIYHGLLSDFAKTKKDPEGAMRLEMELRKLRRWPEFVPALLISGLTKEEKDGAKSDVITGGEPRRDAIQDPTRLF